ncbi:MAG: NIPSNAP family protein [Pseudomonadota bacterium]
MIFDMRTYTCKAGTVAKQMKLYEEFGLKAQTRHLGQPVFYGITETGPLNTYTHIWAYESAGDRETKRAAMQADPEWQAFLAKSAEAGNLLSQENRLMNPAPFFKPKV